MIPAQFDYVRVADVDEALTALADPEARLLAGGHSLVPMMKLRLAVPTAVVDISGLELRGVRADGADVRIGALTTYDELIGSGVDLPDALLEAAAAVGDMQVRNAGTIGGALAHADPACDVAAPALALGARMVVRSPTGVREVAVDGFFTGPFTTALAHQELLIEVVVPRAAPGEGSAYVAFEDRASGYALAGAAVHCSATGFAVALTGLTACPQRLPRAEAALAAGDDAEPAVAALDVIANHDEADHRRHLAVVAIRRAADRARERARAGGS